MSQDCSLLAGVCHNCHIGITSELKMSCHCIEVTQVQERRPKISRYLIYVAQLCNLDMWQLEIAEQHGMQSFAGLLQFVRHILIQTGLPLQGKVPISLACLQP